MRYKWIAKGTSIVQEHKDGWLLIAKTVDAGINEANIIAAAPEMLEVLQNLEKVGMSIRAESVIWQDIRNAIAKAEGL